MATAEYGKLCGNATGTWWPSLRGSINS